MNRIPVPVVYATSVILIVAAGPMPYGYYTLVRIVATVILAWAAMASYENKNGALLYVFGLLAILFNPFIKVPFDKETWQIIDIGVAVFLVATRRQIAESVKN